MAQNNTQHLFYGALLKLYPAAYYKEYAEQMELTLDDMLKNATTTRQRVAIWQHIIFDSVISIPKQQLLTMEGSMVSNPKYVTRSAIASGLLLVPFTAALLAKVLFGAVYGKNLYYSWVWNVDVLRLWVLVFPLVALGISIGTLLIWFIEKHRTEHSTWRSMLFDLRHSWPLLLASGIALGILLIVFGHDSVHCFVQNPLSTLKHWHTTLQCAQQG